MALFSSLKSIFFIVVYCFIVDLSFYYYCFLSKASMCVETLKQYIQYVEGKSDVHVK